MILIFRNVGVAFRHFPDLLTLGQADRAHGCGDRFLALRAAGRQHCHHLLHLVFREQVALLIGMTGLRPAWFRLAARRFCWERWRRRRVGGRWVGRVLRRLVEPGLERRHFSHEERQKHPHLRWGRLPGFFAQFWWSLRRIHEQSMPYQLRSDK